MAQAVRIIPRLDIKGPNLVKGVNLEGLRVIGRPEEFARHYYEQGADEIIYQDVVASLYGRNSLKEIIEKTAKEISVPLTVGGGLRSLEDIKEILRAGADKVAINTAALERPEFISEAARVFGKSTIVVAIEAIRQKSGEYLAYTDNGRNFTGKEVVSWAQEAVDLGAGEILLTSVDREGTGKGVDLELTKAVSQAVAVPVVAHGGVGNSEHVLEALQIPRVNAVSMASILHYEAAQSQSDKFGLNSQGNVDFIKGGRQLKSICPSTIDTVKDLLSSQALLCRRLGGV